MIPGIYAIDLDNKALRFFTDKETFKLMTNITARDHGRVQDLTFEYFFENPYSQGLFYLQKQAVLLLWDFLHNSTFHPY